MLNHLKQNILQIGTEMLVKIETVYPLTEPDIAVSFKDVDISVRRTVIGRDLIFDGLENVRSRIRRACFKDMEN